MHEELRQRVYKANIELYRSGLVLYTWGNVSGIDREAGVWAIKPSGLPYDALGPEDIVLMSMDGKPLPGERFRPSSDAPTHFELYRAFPQIGGVAHTHSSWACVWAQAQMDIPCMGTTQADHFRGDIPCTRPLLSSEIQGDYEAETGRVILGRMEGILPREMCGALVAGHGPFTWGDTPHAAVEHAVILEEVAKTTCFARMLNPLQEGIPAALRDKHFLRKHGGGAYYGQEFDKKE